MIVLSGTNIDARTIIITVAVIAVIVVFVLVKSHFDTKKGVDSEEKRFVEDAVKNVVPAGEPYTAAYAHWEMTEYHGRSSTTRYWYYAIGFNDDRLYVIPLQKVDKELRQGAPYCINKSDLGMVNAKKGNIWMTFYDKDKEEIVTMMVAASNTKDDSFHPVNIQQPEAAAAWLQFMDQWLADVNSANGVTVTGKLGKPLKK